MREFPVNSCSGIAQRLVDVENVLEVGAVIVVGPAKLLGFDQIEDNFADIIGPVNAPLPENHSRQQSEFTSTPVPAEKEPEVSPT